MIKRVRRKFILIGTAATSAAILALILSINLAHISMEERKLDGVVEELAEELAGRCALLSSESGSEMESGAGFGSPSDGGQRDGGNRSDREGRLAWDQSLIHI